MPNHEGPMLEMAHKCQLFDLLRWPPPSNDSVDNSSFFYNLQAPVSPNEGENRNAQRKAFQSKEQSRESPHDRDVSPPANSPLRVVRSCDANVGGV